MPRKTSTSGKSRNSSRRLFRRWLRPRQSTTATFVKGHRSRRVSIDRTLAAAWQHSAQRWCRESLDVQRLRRAQGVMGCSFKFMRKHYIIVLNAPPRVAKKGVQWLVLGCESHDRHVARKRKKRMRRMRHHQRRRTHIDIDIDIDLNPRKHEKNLQTFFTTLHPHPSSVHSIEKPSIHFNSGKYQRRHQRRNTTKMASGSARRCSVDKETLLDGAGRGRVR